MSQPVLEGDWSIKDLLAHITWWEQHMLRTLQRGLRGEPAIPLTSQTDDAETALHDLNAEIFTTNQARPPQEIVTDFQRSYQEVLRAMEALPDEHLADPTSLEAVLERELVPLIAGNTYGHYDEHVPVIRAWLASSAAGSTGNP
jgi:hypothetical protein